MRLISQDGKTDIPYENSVVYVHSVYGYNREEHSIITLMGNDTRLLGKYSTEEKALKVMEEIRGHYQKLIDFDYSAIKGIKDSPSVYYYMPQDDEVTEKSV